MTIYILIYIYMHLIDTQTLPIQDTKRIIRSGTHHRKTDSKGLNEELYNQKHWQSIPALMWTSCSFFTLQI